MTLTDWVSEWLAQWLTDSEVTESQSDSDLWLTDEMSIN